MKIISYAAKFTWELRIMAKTTGFIIKISSRRVTMIKMILFDLTRPEDS